MQRIERVFDPLRRFFRWLLGTFLALCLVATGWGDTIWFKTPPRAWNGRIIEDPADFHFKHRAGEPDYFEFERGSSSNRIGLTRSHPNIARIEKNMNYGEDVLELGAGAEGAPGATETVSLAQPGGVLSPAGGPGLRTAERLEVVSMRDWLYPADSEIPLRVGSVVAPQTAVRTPLNSRAKLGYRQILFLGLLPDTQLSLNGLARETQTGIYQLDVTVEPGGEIWLSVTDKIRLSDTVRFIVNGVAMDTRSTLINVEVTPDNEVVVSNFGLTELPVTLQGERKTLTPTQQYNTAQLSAQPGPSSKARADWDNWDIWTPEKIAFAPEVYSQVDVRGGVYADFPVVRLGEVGDLPKSEFVQPQGTMQIIQAWRQAIQDYINQEGYRPSDAGGMEAGLEEVRAKVAPNNPAVAALPSRDNWGHPFVWRVLPQSRVGEFLIDVHSTGPNGRDDFGLGDDL